MRPSAFLDTSFVCALLNTLDQWHEKSVEWQARLGRELRRLITTEYVLVEIGDTFASSSFRTRAAEVIREVGASRYVEVVPASRVLLADSLALYTSRHDKSWGMTDCASFVIMRQRGCFDALAIDRHFQQAGFRALLLD